MYKAKDLRRIICNEIQEMASRRYLKRQATLNLKPLFGQLLFILADLCKHMLSDLLSPALLEM